MNAYSITNLMILMNVIIFLCIFSESSNSLTHRKVRIAFFYAKREYVGTAIMVSDLYI
jgi:hypothetical protein